MRFPCLIALVNFLPGYLSTLCFVHHSDELFPLMLHVLRCDQPDHLACLREPEDKAEERHTLCCLDDPRFLWVRLQSDLLQFLPDLFRAFLKVRSVIADDQEIVHVPDIIFRPETFLDEMIELIQVADAGDLDHLGSGIIAGLFRVLLAHDTDGPVGHTRIQLLPE